MAENRSPGSLGVKRKCYLWAMRPLPDTCVELGNYCLGFLAAALKWLDSVFSDPSLVDDCTKSVDIHSKL